MSVTKICVAIDESQTSRKALDWAMQHLYSSETTHLDVVTVMQPVDAAVYPIGAIAPIATAAAMNAVVQGLEATRKHEQAHAAELLRQAAEECVRHYNVPRAQIQAHALPAAGGASGVAESIVEFAKLKKFDVVVMGSRGMGSIKRSLMSLVGLGSVSDYCLHNMSCPVLVVRADAKPMGLPEGEHAAQPLQPLQVCVAADESPQRRHVAPDMAALQWAARHLLAGRDMARLNIVTVAPNLPYPLLDEGSAVVAAMENQQWQEQVARAMEGSRNLAARLQRSLSKRCGKLGDNISCCCSSTKVAVRA